MTAQQQQDKLLSIANKLRGEMKGILKSLI